MDFRHRSLTGIVLAITLPKRWEALGTAMRTGTKWCCPRQPEGQPFLFQRISLRLLSPVWVRRCDPRHTGVGCAHSCVCIQKPKKDVECLSSLSLSTFFETGSFTELEAVSVRLLDRRVPGIHPSQSPMLGLQARVVMPRLCGWLGIWTQVFLLKQQTLWRNESYLQAFRMFLISVTNETQSGRK